MRATNLKSIQKSNLEAFLGGIIGSLFVIFFMGVMNRPLEKKEEASKHVTSFNNVANKNKTPPKKRELLQKKEKPKSKPKNMAPDISSLLAGNNFGIKAFQVDLGALSESLLGDMSNVAMTEDTVDVAPVASYRPPLQYPSAARSSGVSGFVDLSLLVSKEGKVAQVKVLDSKPTGTFEEAAIAAVKTWKFNPAIYKGESVSIWVKQKISFNLN